MKGVIKTLMVRSRLFSRDRDAMTAGTLQPNPTTSGTNAFPGNPMIRMKRSIRKAARAMYPESSRNDRNRYRKPMIGIKVATT